MDPSYGQTAYPIKVPKKMNFLSKSCKDYKKSLTIGVYSKKSGMRSLESIFKVQACRLLHSVCHHLTPRQLFLLIMFDGYHNDRTLGRLTFIRQNTKKVGVNSFT